MVKTFTKVESLDQLKNYIACQGRHWPDTNILKNSNLNVTTSTRYESLFKMLSAKRCDYFPRGFHEGQAEIAQRRELYQDLVLYQRIILQYPFTVYAFHGLRFYGLRFTVYRLQFTVYVYVSRFTLHTSS